MKNRIIYILSAVVLLVSVSCNKWLEVSPKSQVPVKVMFTSEDGFKDAATACYIKLKNKGLYGQNLTFTTIEYMAQHWDLDANNNYNDILIRNFEHSSGASITFFEQTYEALYNVIVQANLVLENIETKGHVFDNKDLKDAIKAEMLAVRAFCHFDILRIYGQMPNNPGVKVSLPYADKVTTGDLTMCDYTTFVARLKSDLSTAEALLKTSDPVFKYTYAELNSMVTSTKEPIEIDDFFRHRRFRFNYYAVKALQARMYLYVGDKPSALAAAKSVIEAKSVTGLNYVSLAGTNDINGSYYALPSECLFAISNSDLNSDEFGRLFNIKSVAALKMATAKLNTVFDGISSANNRRNIWGVGSDAAGERYFIKKYYMPTDLTISDSDRRTEKELMPILRLSELYLIAMESSTSLAEINTLYTEYMLARDEVATSFTDMSQVSDMLLKEYRREFFAEGVMFYTYKRLGVTKMLWKTDRDVTEADYIAPRHRTERK